MLLFCGRKRFVVVRILRFFVRTKPDPDELRQQNLSNDSHFLYSNLLIDILYINLQKIQEKTISHFVALDLLWFYSEILGSACRLPVCVSC